MIAQLTGRSIIQDSRLIVDVNGVGYAVLVSDSTLAKLQPEVEVKLNIYTHVREDALELFGFLESADKRLFQLLLGVSGVGPRTALAISQWGAADITQAVQEAQVTFFTKVPRVGKKLAQKIIIDLKSKLGSLRELELGGMSNPKQKEVAEALLSLGFEEQSVYQIINQLDLDQPIQTLVKQALRQLNNK